MVPISLWLNAKQRYETDAMVRTIDELVNNWMRAHTVIETFAIRYMSCPSTGNIQYQTSIPRACLVDIRWTPLRNHSRIWSRQSVFQQGIFCRQGNHCLQKWQPNTFTYILYGRTHKLKHCTNFLTIRSHTNKFPRG